MDAAIAGAVAGLSRAQAQRLIDDELVVVDGVPATKASLKVRVGAVVEVSVPPPEPLEVVAEDLPLDVLFEDADLVVVNKAAGMVVHPAPGHAKGTLVNALLYRCTDLSGVGGVMRPGIVHRLDKDTSGVMVATKSDRAHAGLAAAFADKTSMERAYLGIAAPPTPASRSVWRTLHGRHPTDRKRFSSKVPAGKPAVTHYEIVEKLADAQAALMRFRLETGRTHQIRVHAADHGSPLIGDPVYGKTPRDARVAAAAAALGRQALHAAVLGFTHPVTGEPMRFEVPLPPDMAAAIASLKAPG